MDSRKRFFSNERVATNSTVVKQNVTKKVPLTEEEVANLTRNGWVGLKVFSDQSQKPEIVKKCTSQST